MSNTYGFATADPKNGSVITNQRVSRREMLREALGMATGMAAAGRRGPRLSTGPQCLGLECRCEPTLDAAGRAGARGEGVRGVFQLTAVLDDPQRVFIGGR